MMTCTFCYLIRFVHLTNCLYILMYLQRIYFRTTMVAHQFSLCVSCPEITEFTFPPLSYIMSTTKRLTLTIKRYHST